MARVTNLTRETMDFIVGRGKDGVPETSSLAPGETREIDVSRDGRTRARQRAGAIAIDGDSGKPLRTVQTLSGELPVRE